MHHQTEDSHHGGTSVVKLNGALSELGLGSKFIPSKVDESVSEVTSEFALISESLTNQVANVSKNIQDDEQGYLLSKFLYLQFQ